jgi:hypothetical protein
MSEGQGAAKQRPSISDPQFPIFKFKTKIGSFEWGGMWPDGDSSAVPDNRPRLLINTRLRDGDIRRRGGQLKMETTAIGGAYGQVVGIQNFEVARPYSLYFVQDGCPSVSSTTGFSIGAFDYEQLPYAQPLTYQSALGSNVAIGPFSDNLYAVKDTSFVEIQLFRAEFGRSTLGSAGTSMDIELFVLPSGFTHASFLQSFDGELYVGCINGASSAIYKYDGLTFESAGLTGIAAPTGGGVYREKLIVGYDGSPNYISIMDTSGSWTTQAPSSGTVAMRGPHTTASYQDVFYFAGDTSDVWSYDGTTLAAIGTGTTGLNASALVKDVCVINDGEGWVLAVLWEYADHSEAGITTWDGSSWGLFKDLKDQFPTLNGVYNLRFFKGSVFVAASTTGAGGLWLVSPTNAQDGTYTSYSLSNPSGQIFDAVVF